MYDLGCWGNSPTLAELDIIDCPKLLAHLNEKGTDSWDSYNVYYYTWDATNGSGDWMSLWYDVNTELVTSPKSNPTPTLTSAPPATVTAPAPQVIPATRRSSKSTVIVEPGNQVQLDLGGKQGKKFKSSNKKVATVDQNGVLTIKKSGKVKITFKVGKEEVHQDCDR